MHRVDHACTLDSHSLKIFAEVGPEVAQQDACADSNLQIIGPIPSVNVHPQRVEALCGQIDRCGGGGDASNR